MSMWVSLNDSDREDAQTLAVRQHEEGGTYCVGGTTQATVNITGNYERLLRPMGFSIRDLHGQTGGETAPKLGALVFELGTECSDNYWDWTPGNVGYALSVLMAWAMEHPGGVWRVN